MRIIPLILLCALIGACQPSAGTPQPPSPSPIVTPGGPPPRVTGTVTAGPVCPVEKSPPDPSCAPRAVAGAVIVATDTGGQEVGRTTTAPDGTYVLIVGSTGTAIITAQPVAGSMGTPVPVTVTLAAPGIVLRVDLEYDTGIR